MRETLAPANVGEDEKSSITLDLLEGLLWEAARLRVELDELAAHPTIEHHPTNKKKVRISPLAAQKVKSRASYTHTMQAIARLLNTEVEEHEDDDLSDYE